MKSTTTPRSTASRWNSPESWNSSRLCQTPSCPWNSRLPCTRNCWRVKKAGALSEVLLVISETALAWPWEEVLEVMEVLEVQEVCPWEAEEAPAVEVCP